ncbi:hypothetical protein HDU76_013517 [Blyttiomyces sp. JEL0837]|nr:hypothetical protein HDU76_013517 [Blyttiomyces sp. JEL0837]
MVPLSLGLQPCLEMVVEQLCLSTSTSRVPVPQQASRRTFNVTQLSLLNHSVLYGSAYVELAGYPKPGKSSHRQLSYDYATSLPILSGSSSLSKKSKRKSRHGESDSEYDDDECIPPQRSRRNSIRPPRQENEPPSTGFGQEFAAGASSAIDVDFDEVLSTSTLDLLFRPSHLHSNDDAITTTRTTNPATDLPASSNSSSQSLMTSTNHFQNYDTHRDEEIARCLQASLDAEEHRITTSNQRRASEVAAINVANMALSRVRTRNSIQQERETERLIATNCILIGKDDDEELTSGKPDYCVLALTIMKKIDPEYEHPVIRLPNGTTTYGGLLVPPPNIDDLVSCLEIDFATMIQVFEPSLGDDDIVSTLRGFDTTMNQRIKLFVKLWMLVNKMLSTRDGTRTLLSSAVKVNNNSTVDVEGKGFAEIVCHIENFYHSIPGLFEGSREKTFTDSTHPHHLNMAYHFGQPLNPPDYALNNTDLEVKPVVKNIYNPISTQEEYRNFVLCSQFIHSRMALLNHAHAGFRSVIETACRQWFCLKPDDVKKLVLRARPPPPDIKVVLAMIEFSPSCDCKIQAAFSVYLLANSTTEKNIRNFLVFVTAKRSLPATEETRIKVRQEIDPRGLRVLEVQACSNTLIFRKKVQSVEDALESLKDAAARCWRTYKNLKLWSVFDCICCYLYVFVMKG